MYDRVFRYKNTGTLYRKYQCSTMIETMTEVDHNLEVVQRLLAQVDTGNHKDEGRFANITFNTDNLLHITGQRTGFSNKWHYTMKQKFM